MISQEEQHQKVLGKKQHARKTLDLFYKQPVYKKLYSIL